MAPFTIVVLTEIITKGMEHLAWPATLILIIWWFKDQIKELIRKLRKGKWGSAEWEFSELATAAEIDSQAIHFDMPLEENLEREFERSISISPIETIISKWLEVENILNEVIVSNDLQESEGNPRTGAIIKIRSAQPRVFRHLSLLKKSGLVGSDLIYLIQDLRMMRNEAAHSFDFSPPESAIYNYLATANRVIEVLKKLIKTN